MRIEKITISDIAKALKISSISVSRALSGQPGVSEELRNSIISKAKELGYTKAKKTTKNSILVLHEKPYLQDNSNFSYRIQGIERTLQKVDAEYNIEFIGKKNQNEMLLPQNLAKGNSFDGVIFMGGFNNDYISFISQKIPNRVIFTEYSPCNDYDSVWFNFNNGGYKQCEYLIQNGHKDIGFLYAGSIFRNKDMLLGITTALENYGIPVKSQFLLNVEDNFKDRVLNLINSKDRPTAIICQWDFQAIQLIKLLYENRIRVPDDISVMGSGNIDMSSLTIPSLTTLDFHLEYSCETAVALLLKRIDQPNKPNEYITVNGSLIIRDSVKSLKNK